jgi:hypothetical protein
LTLELPLTGLAYLYLNAAEIEDIPAQLAHYSLEIPDGQFNFPVFVDPAAGARGDMNVLNSVLPSFVPSQAVTIPTGQPFPNLNPNVNANSPLPNANIYYSSTINTQDNPILTIQTKLEEYNGYITIEGTCNQQLTDWYPIIETEEYDNVSATQGYTITGFHPFVRMVFTSNAGVVTNILAR